MKIKTRKRGDFWFVILGDRKYMTAKAEVARWFVATFTAKTLDKEPRKISLDILFDRIAARASNLEKDDRWA